MRDAGQGLVLLEVPLLAAVAVAAAGAARAVLGGVALLNLKHIMYSSGTGLLYGKKRYIGAFISI